MVAGSAFYETFTDYQEWRGECADEFGTGLSGPCLLELGQFGEERRDTRLGATNPGNLAP